MAEKLRVHELSHFFNNTVPYTEYKLYLQSIRTTWISILCNFDRKFMCAPSQVLIGRHMCGWRPAQNMNAYPHLYDHSLYAVCLHAATTTTTTTTVIENTARQLPFVLLNVYVHVLVSVPGWYREIITPFGNQGIIYDPHSSQP